jgi:hypothetical protein
MDKWAHGFSPFYDQSGGFNPTLRPDRVAGVLAAATLPIRELTVPAKLAGRGAQQIVEDLAERKLNLAKFMEEAHPALKDEAGNPHVFYTGTSKDKDFTSFNTERHGSWFTRDPEEASMYAKENDSMGYKYQHGNFERTNTASRVIPVYLSSKNPYTGPKPEEIFRARNYKKAQSDWFDSLKKAGYDSWIPEDTPGLAVMFHRNQIKSAIGNRGTYDIAQKEMNKAHGGSIENTTHDRKLI